MSKIISKPNAFNMDGDNSFQKWLNYTLTMHILPPKDVRANECLTVAREVEECLNHNLEFTDLLLERFHTCQDLEGELHVDEDGLDRVKDLIELIERKYNSLSK